MCRGADPAPGRGLIGATGPEVGTAPSEQAPVGEAGREPLQRGLNAAETASPIRLRRREEARPREIGRAVSPGALSFVILSADVHTGLTPRSWETGCLTITL